MLLPGGARTLSLQPEAAIATHTVFEALNWCTQV
jgi:hypothetical protein